LTQPIIDELRRINAPRVVILGGPGAVSDALAAQVAAILD
jgi:putative cell wall-binding protein